MENPVIGIYLFTKNRGEKRKADELTVPCILCSVLGSIRIKRYNKLFAVRIKKSNARTHDQRYYSNESMHWVYVHQ